VPTPSVEDFLGTWRIARFEKLGFGSAVLNDRYARSQIGKRLTLSTDFARFDAKLLWQGGRRCSRPSYRWATDDEFIGHGWQGLLPSDHPEKREDSLFLDVDCDAPRKAHPIPGPSPIFGCEITNRGDCVAYYDGYSFFLVREEPLTETERRAPAGR
jgi:hypothetical protein